MTTNIMPAFVSPVSAFSLNKPIEYPDIQGRPYTAIQTNESAIVSVARMLGADSLAQRIWIFCGGAWLKNARNWRDAFQSKTSRESPTPLRTSPKTARRLKSWLHADMTGGFRHTSMLMLSIIQLPRYRGVKMGQKKLLGRLKNFPPLFEKKLWRPLRAESKSDLGKNLPVVLSVIVEALRLRRKVFVDGQIVSSCRLEYDLAARKAFDAVALSGEQIPAAAGACFLTISYSPTDEDEILEKILSLGSAVTIVAPENLRERLRQRFAAINVLYK